MLVAAGDEEAAKSLKRSKYILTSRRKSLRQKDEKAENVSEVVQKETLFKKAWTQAEIWLWSAVMMSCWIWTKTLWHWISSKRSWLLPTSSTMSVKWLMRLPGLLTSAKHPKTIASRDSAGYCWIISRVSTTKSKRCAAKATAISTTIISSWSSSTPHARAMSVIKNHTEKVIEAYISQSFIKLIP